MSLNYLNNVIITMLSFNFKNNIIKCFFLKKTYINHIYLYIYSKLTNYLVLLKFNLNNWLVSLIDITGIDTSNYNIYNWLFTFKVNNLILLQYNILDYKTYNRLLLNFFLKINTIDNCDYLFFNANWLERELIEFFNIQFLNKKDNRNLLLDYNFNYNPLLKNFPTEGYEELYFNFSNYSLSYVYNEFIEL